MKSIVTTIATLIVAAALTACGKEPEAAPAPVFEVPTVPAATAASEPAKV